jgi:hypothetical protein
VQGRRCRVCEQLFTPKSGGPAINTNDIRSLVATAIDCLLQEVAAAATPDDMRIALERFTVNTDVIIRGLPAEIAAQFQDASEEKPE